jgi:hypothetical protein
MADALLVFLLHNFPLWLPQVILDLAIDEFWLSLLVFFRIGA